MNSKAAALVSGGLDSGALLAFLSRRFDEVQPIFLRQGLRWEGAELKALKRFSVSVSNLRPLVLLKMPMSDVYGRRHWSVEGSKVPGARSADQTVELPGRNLTLSLKAAIYCAARGIPILAIGSLAGNPFRDATPAFFRLWSRALSAGLASPVRVVAPFRLLSKAQLIRRFQQWPLYQTFSCLAPVRGHHCGRCNKCAERQKAFRQAQILDQTIYEKN